MKLLPGGRPRVRTGVPQPPPPPPSGRPTDDAARRLPVATSRWRPSAAGAAARLAVLTVILGSVLAAPLLLPAPLVLIAAKAVVFMLAALSMNVLMGYAGQVSLGHGAFVAVGAFASGYVLTIMQLPWAAAAVAAMSLGGLAAAVLGAVALRVRGLYLALVTLAYDLFVTFTVLNVRALTGGGAGQPAPRPAFATDDLAYVYLGLVIVALVWVFDWRLTASKAGRAIQALRDDERVAASWGIHVTRYKLLAFVISGTVAGLAGAYFAGIEQIVATADFGFTLSLTIVLMTVVGGLGSRPGVVQGAIVFAALPTLLETAHEQLAWWPRWLGSLWEPFVGALLLVLVLVFYPGGIAQQQAPLLRWLGWQRLHAPEHVALGGGGGGPGARP
ncbi:MAG TPA: branched-chain amino acid ABC transporter permease [Nitriliruptorales bacterium]|nr:branched-chain amino acid ABC transporter permease [Nitriliruptorales bacterium]